MAIQRFSLKQLLVSFLWIAMGLGALKYALDHQRTNSEIVFATMVAGFLICVGATPLVTSRPLGDVLIYFALGAELGVFGCFLSVFIWDHVITNHYAMQIGAIIGGAMALLLVSISKDPAIDVLQQKSSNAPSRRWGEALAATLLALAFAFFTVEAVELARYSWGGFFIVTAFAVTTNVFGWLAYKCACERAESPKS